MLAILSAYSGNGGKHRCKHVSDSVSSSYDTLEHFDHNIASLTDIVINCQFLPAALIAITIEGMSPALSQVVL